MYNIYIYIYIYTDFRPSANVESDQGTVEPKSQSSEKIQPGYYTTLLRSAVITLVAGAEKKNTKTCNSNTRQGTRARTHTHTHTHTANCALIRARRHVGCALVKRRRGAEWRRRQ